MQEKLNGIVIDIIRHNDRYNVVTLYTRSRGRLSFLSPVGKGRNASLRAARIAPLAWLDAEVNFKGGRELQILSNISLHRVWHSLYFDPVKSALTLFVSEFLNRLMRTSSPDSAAFSDIAAYVEALDTAGGSVANYHILFLITMMDSMGIRPHVDSEGGWFDMRAGEFTEFRPAHPDYLAPQDTEAMKHLLRMNSRNESRFRLSGSERTAILRRLLQYYEIHLPGAGRLKSLLVLRDVFSNG
ncbi:MAG: DNA repair protein RecO [Muribaculum sp.]|nr:DNA repair protein RecO [Muribaculum sp.]